ncbi:MAG: hypothetical protein VW877_15875 [Pseudomonadaceae bacterium]
MALIWLALLLIALFRFVSTTKKIHAAYLKVRKATPDIFLHENNTFLINGNEQLIFTIYLLKRRYVGNSEVEAECERVRSTVVLNIGFIGLLFIATFLMFLA